MENIVGEFISVFVLMAIMALLIIKLMKIRKQGLFIFVYALSTTLIHIAGLILLADSNMLLKAAISFATKLICLRIFATERWRKVVFVFLVLLLVETLTELLMAGVFSLIFSSHDLTDINDGATRMLVRLIGLPIYLSIMYFTYFIWTKTVSSRSEPSFNTFMIFLASQALTLSLSCTLIFSGAEISSKDYTLIIVAVLTSIVADVFVFRAIQKIDRTHMLEKNYLAAEYQLSIQTEYYNNLIGHMEYTNKLRHEFRNQLQTAYMLFSKGEESHAGTHLQEMEAKLSDTDMPHCGNPIIDAIIVDKSSLCQKHGIELQTDLSVSNKLGIENIYLCSVVANILDNAIEACSRLENSEKKIVLKAYEKAGWLVISESNEAVEGNGKKADTQFLPKHGLGLSIIRDIAEKYEGKVEVLNENNRFSITVWLSCSAHSDSGVGGIVTNVESFNMR